MTRCMSAISASWEPKRTDLEVSGRPITKVCPPRGRNRHRNGQTSIPSRGLPRRSVRLDAIPASQSASAPSLPQCEPFRAGRDGRADCSGEPSCEGSARRLRHFVGQHRPQARFRRGDIRHVSSRRPHPTRSMKRDCRKISLPPAGRRTSRWHSPDAGPRLRLDARFSGCRLRHGRLVPRQRPRRLCRPPRSTSCSSTRASHAFAAPAARSSAASYGSLLTAVPRTGRTRWPAGATSQHPRRERGRTRPLAGLVAGSPPSL